MINEQPEPTLNLFLNSVDSPLVQVDVIGSNGEAIVDRISTLNFVTLWPLTESIALSGDLPLHIVNRSNKQKFRLGDIRLGVKKSFSSPLLGFEYASAVDLVLPTGDTDEFISNGSLGISGKFIISREFVRTLFSLNISYQVFNQSQFQNLDHSQQLILGGGISYRLNDWFRLSIEASSSWLPNNDMDLGPGDVFLGGKFKFNRANTFSFGVSMAPVDSWSSSFRWLLGYQLLPFAEREKPRTIKEIKEVKIIEKVNNCGIKKEVFRLPSRNFPVEELRSLQLPYNSTADHKLSVINYGEMSGMAENGVPYVKNSQVLFSIDTSALPPKSSLISIHEATLKLDVKKISSERSTETEILCLLHKRICSGELYRKKNWIKSINQKFFEGKETPNDYFSRQYLQGRVGKVDGKGIYAAELALSLKRLVKNSMTTNLRDIFYSRDRESSNGRLDFSVADDTYISTNAYMEAVVSYDSCKMLNSMEEKTP